MSATSETEIANLALSMCGQPPITDINTDTKKAGDLCRLHYTRCRDSLLRDHPWNFAIRRAALAQVSGETPAFEFSYYYELPSDCIRVLRTNFETPGALTTDAVYGYVGIHYWSDYSAPIPYRIEGRRLACSESTCKIEYVARVTDVAQFDEAFTQTLVAKLAMSICYQLTQDKGLTVEVTKAYQTELLGARSNDAMEGTPRDIVDTSTWVIVRQ